MPVTIIKEQDRTVGLTRVLQHDCSLGELSHQLRIKVQQLFIAWAEKGKERVNWHDLFHAAIVELEIEGIIKSNSSFQQLEPGTLMPQGFIEAVQGYNSDPEHFKLSKMVFEKSV